MASIYDDYLELIHECESIPDISKSIFDITGYPHHENVSSNILAFYLNPNNEHGLGNLLYSSLMNLSDGNESQPDNIQINREVSTQKGGRLDIVIETDTQIMVSKTRYVIISITTLPIIVIHSMNGRDQIN